MRVKAILLAGIAAAIVGCGSGDSNYSTEVKMSEADKAREKEVMAGQTAPGAAPGSPATSNPSTLKVPGKSR